MKTKLTTLETIKENMHLGHHIENTFLVKYLDHHIENAFFGQLICIKVNIWKEIFI